MQVKILVETEFSFMKMGEVFVQDDRSFICISRLAHPWTPLNSRSLADPDNVLDRIINKTYQIEFLNHKPCIVTSTHKEAEDIIKCL